MLNKKKIFMEELILFSVTEVSTVSQFDGLFYHCCVGS